MFDKAIDSKIRGLLLAIVILLVVQLGVSGYDLMAKLFCKEPTKKQVLSIYPEGLANMVCMNCDTLSDKSFLVSYITTARSAGHEPSDKELKKALDIFKDKRK